MPPTGLMLMDSSADGRQCRWTAVPMDSSADGQRADGQQC